MKKIAYFIWGGILFFTSCCNIDEHLSVNNLPEESVKVTANMPGRGGDTRVAFNDDKDARVLYVDWKESGEKFSVVREGKNTTFTQTASTEDEKNIFEGTCPDAEGSGLYWAIYPHNENVSDETQVPYDLSNQTGILDENKTYMYASSSYISNGTELDFRQMTAILKPQFSLQNDGEKVQTVILTLPEDSYSKGTFNATDQSYSPDNDSKREIKVFANNLEDVYIYLPAIEVTETKSIQVELHTTHSMYIGSIQLGKSIKAGKLYETSASSMTLEEAVEFVWKSGITAETPTGTGTEGEPYLIKNAANLQWLLDQVNKNEIENIEDTNNNTGKDYKLMHNLVINSSESSPWTPIGIEVDYIKEFKGTFDGNDCIISGTLVSGSRDVNQHLYFGFFGHLRDISHIKNMTLNLNVTGGSTFKEDPYRGAPRHSSTGILAGGTKGVIENCSTYGNVTGGKANGEYWDTVNMSDTGGIVGLHMGTIKNCTNYSNITGNYGNGGSHTGGIAGRCGMFQGSSFNGYIESCVNYGNITGYSGGNAGGIVGYLDRGKICTCNKDYSSLNTILGNGTTSQIDGCTGNHLEEP